MQFELYQHKTENCAYQQTRLLDQARDRLNANKTLSALEENGVLHSLQILIENAIGKAKHLLKYNHIPVPASAYDAFKLLMIQNIINQQQLSIWNTIIGLRNRIVYAYINIDIEQVLTLVKNNQYQHIRDFLYQKF